VIERRETIFSDVPPLQAWFGSPVSTLAPGSLVCASGAGPLEGETWCLGLGDLVLFPGASHIAVASGFQDQLFQSGYKISTPREALRLAELRRLDKQGLLKAKPYDTTSNIARTLHDAGKFVTGQSSDNPTNPAETEFQNWPTGEYVVRLQYLRLVFADNTPWVAIYPLKPECRDLIDPTGPLGAYPRGQTRG
jgi:hypothetical protein